MLHLQSSDILWTSFMCRLSKHDASILSQTWHLFFSFSTTFSLCSFGLSSRELFASLSLVAGAWTERKKIFHGGSFLKLAKVKKGLFLTFRMGTSNARNKNLRPLFNTNIPPISGKYGLRNHFWSLESGFLMRKREENDFFSKSAKLPILSFWILNVHIIICQFQKRSTVIHFFLSVHAPATSVLNSKEEFLQGAVPSTRTQRGFGR